MKDIALPQAVEVRNDTRTAAELVKNGFALLKRIEFGQAGKLFEQVLNANPKASSAYIGLLMAEQNAKNASEMVRSSIVLGEDVLFQEALKFASPKMRQTLDKYIQLNRANFNALSFQRR